MVATKTMYVGVASLWKSNSDNGLSVCTLSGASVADMKRKIAPPSPWIRAIGTPVFVKTP